MIARRFASWHAYISDLPVPANPESYTEKARIRLIAFGKLFFAGPAKEQLWTQGQCFQPYTTAKLSWNEYFYNAIIAKTPLKGLDLKDIRGQELIAQLQEKNLQDLQEKKLTELEELMNPPAAGKVQSSATMAMASSTDAK